MARVFSQSKGAFIDVPDAPAQATASGGNLSANPDIQGILQKAAILDLAQGGKNISKISGVSNLFPGPSAPDLAEQKRKKDIAEAAKNYLDTYQSLVAKGDLNSEDARRQLSFVAGRYNSIAGFGEGGKTLTASELGILAPTLLKTQRQRDQNLLEKALGTQPGMTKGLLEEDPAQAAEKMKLALKYTNPELLAQYEGVGQTSPQVGAPDSGKSLKGLVNNAMGDAVQIGQGVQGLADLNSKTNPLNFLTRPRETMKAYGQASQLPGALLEGTKESYNNLLGRPGEGGDIVGRAGQNAYDNPLETVLNLLPFLPVGKASLAGKAGQTTKATSLVDDVARTAPKAAGVADDVAGRAATSIAVPNVENVTQSQGLMKQALQMTKSNTATGIAKELETFSTKANKFIDDLIDPVNQKVGPMPGNELVDQVMNVIAQTDVGATNPKLLKVLRNNIEQRLSSGSTELGSEMLSKGQTFMTDMKKINETRKLLNKDVKSWFDRGRPVVSAADQLSALRWQVSNALKEILVSNPALGKKIAEAISKQHVAIEAAPAIAKTALGGSAEGGMFRMLQSGVRAATFPLRVAGARSLQGSPSDVLKSILSASPQ